MKSMSFRSTGCFAIAIHYTSDLKTLNEPCLELIGYLVFESQVEFGYSFGRLMTSGQIKQIKISQTDRERLKYITAPIVLKESSM